MQIEVLAVRTDIKSREKRPQVKHVLDTEVTDCVNGLGRRVAKVVRIPHEPVGSGAAGHDIGADPARDHVGAAAAVERVAEQRVLAGEITKVDERNPATLDDEEIAVQGILAVPTIERILERANRVVRPAL